MTIETFSEWKREAERILIAWHRDDPGHVGEEHWRRCFARADEVIESAPVRLSRAGSDARKRRGSRCQASMK
jgi:hypothetical protein